MPAPTTTSTAVALATRAVRAGMARRPRPGSSANRIPITAATGRPAVASRDARVGARDDVDSAGRRPARHAGTAAAAVTARTASAAPANSTSQSACRPGCRSARRAVECGRGANGERAMASGIPSTAPAAATLAARASMTACSSRPLMPTARRIGSSVASSCSWRPSDCPMMKSPATAATIAKSCRARPCKLTDRVTPCSVPVPLRKSLRSTNFLLLCPVVSLRHLAGALRRTVRRNVDRRLSV